MADGAITEKDLIKARKAEAKERKMAAKKAKFEKSKRKGHLFVRITLLIGITTICLNVLETVGLIEFYIRPALRQSTVDRYVEVTNEYADSIRHTFDQYFAYLSYYTEADVLETGDTEQIVNWMIEHVPHRPPVFDYIGWADNTAKFYSDRGAVSNIPDRDYYQAIMQMGKDYFIDDPVTSKATGQTIVHVCKAAKVDGRTVGFFCGVIAVENISAILEDINLNGLGAGILRAGSGQKITLVGEEYVLDMYNECPESEEISEQITSDTFLGISDTKWVKGDDGEVLCVYTPVPKTKWSLAIMLDGKTYYNTPAAKDRFISQPSVLEGLGWRICRVWTLDWFDEPERVMAQIKDAIANAKAPIVKQETQKEEPVFIQEAPVEAGLNARPYVSTKITELGTMQDFYNEANTQNSLSLMTAILETEAPIERNLFMKKVFSAWGISRSTQKAETHFAQLMGSLSKQLTVDSEHAFIWGGAVDTSYMSYYRTPTEQMQRSAEEIASQEYTCAALEVLDEQLALSESDLIRETAKKFGFTRLTAPIENTVRFALTQALQSGRIVKLDNGNYSRT